MTKFKPVIGKAPELIYSEWDILAPLRYDQILSKKDITFHNVLLPTITRLLPQDNNGSLLDAGCGVGIMTEILSDRFEYTVGVDPSKISIEIAKRHAAHKVRYLHSSIEDYAEHHGTKFDVLIANMVLMDTVNIDSFLMAIASLMHKSSSFIFSITHPAFWPSYYGYENEDWFRYDREVIIETPFRISNDKSNKMISTHVHRSMASYVKSLSRNGIAICNIEEPFPAPDIELQYPEPWHKPRYLISVCRLA